MNVFLWIVQAIVAGLLALSGLGKLAQPKDRLAGRYPWVRDMSSATVWLIGVLELLGAIGLIAPAATGVATVLTPIAATGIAVMMIFAAGLHLRRREPSGVAVTTVLIVLAALVAWGRFGPYGW
ncbi:DoxX family protein [Microbispora sp. RL4-1S]|uniref:DoxX family protein n=1 Tax=Microbispora oryzae TaxID=2806554 RepID=A0A940WCX8_9ACTN|nr:DoxX family protein [Microbispora oryzae]MBP2703219.1 DoxX family protein [Microbispora oryzae]